MILSANDRKNHKIIIRFYNLLKTNNFGVIDEFSLNK